MASPDHVFLYLVSWIANKGASNGAIPPIFCQIELVPEAESAPQAIPSHPEAGKDKVVTIGSYIAAEGT